jgi:hypothetical protein
MISIRVQGLPVEAGRAVTAITANPDLDVHSVRGPYGNRNGAEVRIYVTAELIPLDTRPAAELSTDQPRDGATRQTNPKEIR